MNINKGKNINSPTNSKHSQEYESSNFGVITNGNTSAYNNRSEINNFQENSHEYSDHGFKTQQSNKKSQISGDLSDNNSKKQLMDYEDRSHKLDFLEGLEDKNNNENENDSEDDDQRYVKKDDLTQLQEVNEQIMQDILSDLEDYNKALDGIRPTTNHNRSLSHEHGGLEQKTVTHDAGGKDIDEDVWDKQTEEISHDFEEENDRLSDIDESSLRQSFIHKQKQKKKGKRRGRRGDKGGPPEGADLEGGTKRLSILDARSEQKESFADRVSNTRNNSSNSKGGGGIQMF